VAFVTNASQFKTQPVQRRNADSCRPVDDSCSAADGILRRVSDRTWAGTLHGYRVQVFYCGDSWCMAVINPQGHVETCPRIASFAEGAGRAREWIEKRRPRDAS
jgi:hypothetical protein